MQVTVNKEKNNRVTVVPNSEGAFASYHMVNMSKWRLEWINVC